MKSTIINNNDNSFREEYYQNKKKNQTIFIEISNNPNNQNKQPHYNNHFTHINKVNNNLHKKTKPGKNMSIYQNYMRGLNDFKIWYLL